MVRCVVSKSSGRVANQVAGGSDVTMSTPDDEENSLVAEAIAGNQLAIQQLLMRYHYGIESFIARRIPAGLRGVLSAEDICQEAYVTAVHGLSDYTFHGAHSFQNWLLTIAERKLIDAVRAQQALKRGGHLHSVKPPLEDSSSVITLLSRLAIHEHTPSQSAANHELATAVQKGLDQLKEEQRMALRGRYIDGLSTAELAQRMGRSEGAVLKLCERGLRGLSEQIGDVARFFSRKA